MLKYLLLSTAMLFAGNAVLAADQQSQAAGVWETASGGYVQLYEEGDLWKGIIVGSKSGKARKDTENPDESRRDRRLLGVTVLKGLEYTDDDKFKGGEIYDPNNGKTYSAKAEQKGPDELEVRGYIGISLIGRSQTWKRIDPKAENVHQDLLHKPVPAAPQS